MNIGKYRWTEEEMEEVFDQILHHLKPKDNKPAELVTAGELLDKAEKLVATGDTPVGLSTGFRSIDRLTRGIGPSEVVVIFGDTSHGKSQLAQNITLNLALAGQPVLFVGLEMSNTENTLRFMQMEPSRDKLVTLPILYPQSTDIGYKDIDSLVGTAKAEGVVLVVLDHLHMFARDVTNLANELSLICHEFKRVARKYELPIIVISHISRSKDRKGVPELADLKGSSSIEQDADICLAVHRDMNLPDDQQKLKVILRKNRLRGRKHTKAELVILDNARLKDPEITVFPGAA